MNNVSRSNTIRYEFRYVFGVVDGSGNVAIKDNAFIKTTNQKDDKSHRHGIRL